jgi:ribonuclease HII
MLSFRLEQKLFSSGYKLIAGIDEAGRGPLAGPVVAACVSINNRFRYTENYKFIKNSKKLSEQRREEQFNLIVTDKNFTIGIGITDHLTIDRINILQATYLSMKAAVKNLKIKPEIVLVDGRDKIPHLKIEQRTIVRGDDSTFIIAAASIVAKVTRDRIMQQQHKIFPQYNFKKHKGYGTKEHLTILKLIGPSAIHRYSFSPLKNLLVSQQ